MTDHEPSSAEVASQSAQSTPTTAGVEPVPSSPATEPENTNVSPSRNGKESKSGTPKGRNGKDGKDKESPGEAKAKRPMPYVNEDRVKTGGSPREKLSTEELTARMERIRLNNEKIKERRAAVQADEQAFQDSQAALRAKAATQRKIQSTIDEKRAANAKRKMEKLGVREWDSFKKGGNNAGGAGSNASMHAPTSPSMNAGDASADENTTGTKESSQVSDQVSRRPEEGERGRTRGGRGVDRGRARGRGGAARGGGRGGGAGDSRRDKAPHIKDSSQDKPEDTSTADWGAAADEWGKATDVDASQTGIAITTNEEDPWGSADDPWANVPAT